MSRFPQMLQMNAVVTLPVWEDLLPKPLHKQNKGMGPLQPPGASSALFVLYQADLRSRPPSSLPAGPEHLSLSKP